MLLAADADELKITPRVVYQEVQANGFNREEFYNLYDNQFTTGRPRTTSVERKQYLKLREKFRDKTSLADLTVSYDFGRRRADLGHQLHQSRHPVSRDASALTGSVACRSSDCPRRPAACLPFEPARHDQAQAVDAGTAPRLDRRRPVPMGVRRLLQPRRPQLSRSACPRRAMTPSSTLALGAGGPSVAPSTTASPARHSPYNADLAVHHQAEGAVRRSQLQVRPVQADRRRPLVRLQGKRDFISGGVFSNGDTRIGDKTKSNGFSPRVIVSWEPNRNLSVNVQVAKGFRLGGINDPLNIPLCTPADLAIFGGSLSDYDDETLWNYEAGVKYSKHGMTFNAAVFHNESRTCRSRSTPAAARRASCSTCPRRIRTGSRPNSRSTRCRASTCRSPAACIERQVRLHVR